MSDIDFQNGFIVGMATRGLTISRTVIEGGDFWGNLTGVLLQPTVGVVTSVAYPDALSGEIMELVAGTVTQVQTFAEYIA